MYTDRVILAQQGDRESFEALMDAIGGRLESTAAAILRDPDQAKDATQRALVSIWRFLPRLRDPARFDAWSYQVLLRACYAEARQTRRWMPNILAERALQPNVPDDVSGIVDRDQLERAFRRLSLQHRAVVVLHHYLDLPREEVAQVLGVPIGTVHSRLRHAMAALRAALEADARAAVPEHPPREAAR